MPTDVSIGVSIEDDAGLRALIASTHSIAVLGIKAGETEDAYRVPRYLQAAGHRILPVNPKLQSVLGEPCAARLADLGEPVDMIDVFRASQHIARHVDEILAMDPRPRCVWLQLGIRDDASATRLETRGIAVVQDRCLLVEHRRLLGAGWMATAAARAPAP